MKLDVNARFATQRMTGVQRYALEVIERLPAHLEDAPRLLAPNRPYALTPSEPVSAFGFLGGHAWEQLELPFARDRDHLLFSPCNVGPLSVRHQVVTIHDVFSITHPEWVSRAFHTWYRLLLPRLAKRVEHIITVSEYAKTTIVRTLDIPHEKVTVTPLAVGERFRPASGADQEQVRSRLGLPPAFILTLGSLEPRKNLTGVLEAWLGLPQEARLPLVVAGGLGNSAVFGRFDLASIRAQGVRLLGYVPDAYLPGLYSAATLFVYPSFEEGFGIPPLEALACGTSVVTSNTSALREFCAPYATLVDPRDPSAIRSGMQSALGDPEPEIARRGRAKQVAARFTWAHTTRLLAEVLLRYS